MAHYDRQRPFAATKPSSEQAVLSPSRFRKPRVARDSLIQLLFSCAVFLFIVGRMVRNIAAGLIALMVGCGCERTEKITLPPVKIEVVNAGPTKAQPKLPTLKLWIGAHEIEAEIAATGPSIQAGMMFRTNMAENAGMLFVFPYTHQASFWMKNTLVPLSIGFIDPEGRLLETNDMFPLKTNAVVSASSEVQYVLEVNQGWFKKNAVGPGTLIRTERGTLRETFFGRQGK